MRVVKLGQSIKRSEDLRFTTGKGNYVDDIKLVGMAHGIMVRSPYGHAKILSIDTEEAKEMPGVLAVLTHLDADSAGLQPMPCGAPLKNRDGSRLIVPERPVLARDRVRYVGDCVAFVIAETQAQAKDAAEAVLVDYEDLETVSSVSVAPEGIQLHQSHQGNLAFDYLAGNEEGTQNALKTSAYRVSLEMDHNRIAPTSMEPRACIGTFDESNGRFTLQSSSQGAPALQERIAGILGIEKEDLRVVTPDVGGGFGMKMFPYPEQAITLLAAKLCRRPVKWTGDRTESFLSDAHGRAVHTHAELGIDQAGRITALDIRNIADLGAYFSFFGPMIPTAAGGRVVGGVYDIPNVSFAVKGYFTNTAPTDAFRGAGRPEAAYIIERLIDHAAREIGDQIGLDAAELRRRNYIKPTPEGVKNWFGVPFDSGEFAAVMEDTMNRADWSGFSTRKEEANGRGCLRGIGMAYYVEITGGAPTETARVKFLDNDEVELWVGTQSNGQGHETAFAQLLSDRLGIPFEQIRLCQGDTDQMEVGGGTGGSRSGYMAGSAIDTAAKAVIEKGRKVAGHLLEAAEEDIEFSTDGEEGAFVIAGTDRRIPIMEIARAARQSEVVNEVGLQMVHGLDEEGNFTAQNSTLPNGCHICEVEIDPSTGVIKFDRYTVVDDYGYVMNPMLVEGQVQGGIASGISQALVENIVYDNESSQLVTGSLMDYGIARADDLPNFDTYYNNDPTPSNPLGAKGCGEAGTVGAIPAAVNAVVDALSELGVKHVDMPLTPEKIWRTIQDAR